jgi:hypothetical protein
MLNTSSHISTLSVNSKSQISPYHEGDAENDVNLKKIYLFD